MPHIVTSALTQLPVDGIIGSFLLTLFLLPLARRFSFFTDKIPPVGGPIFLLSVSASLFFSSISFPLHLAAGCSGVGLIGLLDDLKALSPRRKTVLLFAVVAVSIGLGGGRSFTGYAAVDFALSAAWLVWMCNAFNVLDAVDGLSGGVGSITLSCFAVIASGLGLSGLSAASALAAASLFAYLFYNFHPARVYMGDAGSLLIGFLLGEAALELSAEIGGIQGVATALLLVAIPCFECVFLIIIRIAKVTMPSVSTNDHPTMRLILAGSSVRAAVLKVYTGTLALSLASVVCWVVDPQFVWMIGSTAIIALGILGVGIARVDASGDGVDGRPGSVFDKHWLIHRIVHKRMAELSNRADGVLVDLGCGNRPYERLFAEHADRYFGVDLNPERYMQGRIDMVSDSEALAIGDGKVQTILSNQVLEHLREPGMAMDEIARVLRPGGLGIITAPHIWGIHEEPRDYFRFTPYGLRHLAERAGLKVERVDAMAGYWVTAGTRFCYYLESFDRGLLRPLVALMNAGIQASAFVLDLFHRVEGDAWNHLLLVAKPDSGPEGET